MLYTSIDGSPNCISAAPAVSSQLTADSLNHSTKNYLTNQLSQLTIDQRHDHVRQSVAHHVEPVSLRHEVVASLGSVGGYGFGFNGQLRISRFGFGCWGRRLFFCSRLGTSLWRLQQANSHSAAETSFQDVCIEKHCSVNLSEYQHTASYRPWRPPSSLHSPLAWLSIGLTRYI